MIQDSIPVMLSKESITVLQIRGDYIMDDIQIEMLRKEHPNISGKDLQSMHNLIKSFIELFGNDEYINFHNNFMLPLMNRTYLKNDKRKH